jgi:hypothetical protein
MYFWLPASTSYRSVAIPLYIFFEIWRFFSEFFKILQQKKKNNNDIGKEIPNPIPGKKNTQHNIGIQKIHKSSPPPPQKKNLPSVFKHLSLMF